MKMHRKAENRCALKYGTVPYQTDTALHPQISQDMNSNLSVVRYDTEPHGESYILLFLCKYIGTYVPVHMYILF